MKPDAADLRILDAIRRDGRITRLALAEKAGLSPSPCRVRLRKMEQAGIVTGYRARIAVRRIAPVTAAIMRVTPASHRQADFARFERVAAGIPEITACWSAGGGVDYFLMVLAPDIEAYQALIDSLLARGIGIDRYFTYIVTRTVKEDAPLPLAALAPPEG